jgi:hypothetical protein
MKIFYELVWLWQRLVRRKIGIAKISKPSISINQVESSILAVSNSLRGKRRLNDYKQPLDAHSKIIKLREPILNPKTGVMWIKKQILEESTVWPVSKLLKWEPTPLFYQKVSNTSINLPDNGYYHFVIEDLPRFYEASKNQQFNQVIIGKKTKYVIDTLSFLKITNFIIKKYPICCNALIFSEKNIGGIFTKFDHLGLLEFSKEIKSTNSNQILFIDRKNKQKGYFDRGIRYADIIASKFEKFNISRVYLEDLSFIEQISLIKSAKLVIGFHGAGLANIVWIDHPVKIFEITEERIMANFEHISSVCGHEYTMMKASKLAEYDLAQISKLFDC